MPKTRNKSSPNLQPPMKKLKIEAAAHESEDEDDSTYTSGQEKSSSRSKQSKGTRRKSKLSMLPSLPLDILFEVFGHLFPIDLLHLARTNKDFRDLLMQKSATTVWKSVFAQIPDLPDCPPDMSYPAFAHLAFEAICHNCSATNIRNIAWTLRTRLCAKCAKTLLFDSHKLNLDVEEDNLIADYVAFEEDYLGMECCLVSDRDKFREELKQHEDDREEFLNEREKTLDERAEHANNCKDWSEFLADERAKELDGIREERRAAIEAKLVEMGYNKEIEFLNGYGHNHRKREYPPFAYHPLVRQNRHLKDKGWESIRDTLKDYMEQVKSDRLKKEREALIWKRRQHASNAWFAYRDANCIFEELLPNQIDIWTWKPVMEVIEQPSSVDVTQDSFSKVFMALPSFLEGWQEQKIDQLLRVARIGLDSWYPTIDELQLAICVLSCSQDHYHSCYKEYLPHDEQPCMWYPEFIHHPCNALTSKWSVTLEKEETIKKLGECRMVSAHGEGPNFRRREWSSRWLSFDEKASKTVKSILKACGMPETTKVQTLDEADPRLVCLKCSFGAKCDGDRQFSVMTWRNAVQHNLRKHFGDGHTQFQKISALDAVQARTLEKAEPAKRLALHGPDYPKKPPERPWRCTLCKDRPEDRGSMTLAEMRSHYNSRQVSHSGTVLDALEEGTNYYRAYDLPPPQPWPVRMKPRDPEDQTEPAGSVSVPEPKEKPKNPQVYQNVFERYGFT